MGRRSEAEPPPPIAQTDAAPRLRGPQHPGLASLERISKPSQPHPQSPQGQAGRFVDPQVHGQELVHEHRQFCHGVPLPSSNRLVAPDVRKAVVPKSIGNLLAELKNEPVARPTV